MPAERLQKIIAAAGVASRRSAEKLISSGAVSVNGTMVTELGTKADPEQDHIRVNGKLLQGPERQIYLLMNKPKGYVTTVSDPEGRPTVMDLLRGIRARVYPVGRLDYASEGLLLLTNDGELSNKLMKASSHVPKVYVVKVAGTPNEVGLEKLRRGLSIPVERRFVSKAHRNRSGDAEEKGNDDRSKHPRSNKAEADAKHMIPKSRNAKPEQRMNTAPTKVRLVREGDNPWYELTLTEGKNRQIRRMFEEIGHHVEKIKRVRYGPLSLDIPPGEFRRLSTAEVEKLKVASGARRPTVRREVS
ncbi:MAG: pseudouridine synthase [Terriglobales bacterium]